MTPDEINRLIAEKVMGWVEATPTDPRRLYWKGSQGPLETSPSAALIGTYFDPYHRIDHAMMALEKYRKDHAKQVIRVEFWHDEIVCTIFADTKCLHYLMQAEADTPSAAISLALVEACKEKKEG